MPWGLKGGTCNEKSVVGKTSRRHLSIDVSLGVCTLPGVKKNSSQKIVRVGVLSCVLYGTSMYSKPNPSTSLHALGFPGAEAVDVGRNQVP